MRSDYLQVCRDIVHFGSQGGWAEVMAAGGPPRQPPLVIKSPIQACSHGKQKESLPCCHTQLLSKSCITELTFLQSQIYLPDMFLIIETRARMLRTLNIILRGLPTLF